MASGPGTGVPVPAAPSVRCAAWEWPLSPVQCANRAAYANASETATAAGVQAQATIASASGAAREAVSGGQDALSRFGAGALGELHNQEDRAQSALQWGSLITVAVVVGLAFLVIAYLRTLAKVG